jgi:hypothetical protein
VRLFIFIITHPLIRSHSVSRLDGRKITANFSWEIEQRKILRLIWNKNHFSTSLELGLLCVCVCVFCSPFVDAAGDAEVHAKKMKRMERKKRFWCSDWMVVEMGGGGR